MQNRIKSRNYFSIYQYQNFRNFNSKHLQWSKADYPKKKNILRKDTLWISVAAVGRCTVKKVSFKNLPPVYWHITNMIFITFKTHDKTCSKIEKAWFLWVPGISGNLVVKSKLCPRSGTSLEAVEPHP